MALKVYRDSIECILDGRYAGCHYVTGQVYEGEVKYFEGSLHFTMTEQRLITYTEMN